MLKVFSQYEYLKVTFEEIIIVVLKVFLNNIKWKILHTFKHFFCEKLCHILKQQQLVVQIG